jgi:hypothetical protein
MQRRKEESFAIMVNYTRSRPRFVKGNGEREWRLILDMGRVGILILMDGRKALRFKSGQVGLIVNQFRMSTEGQVSLYYEGRDGRAS